MDGYDRGKRIPHSRAFRDIRRCRQSASILCAGLYHAMRMMYERA
nr:MAG TPA: hypothetical protein [Caudoviricetes sp.]